MTRINAVRDADRRRAFWRGKQEGFLKGYKIGSDEGYERGFDDGHNFAFNVREADAEAEEMEEDCDSAVISAPVD